MADSSNGRPAQHQESAVLPAPVLAGHLVIYDDAVAFRPDDAPEDSAPVVRPLISMARDQLLELLTPGDGGMLATIMNGQIPKLPKNLLAMRGELRNGR